MDLIIETDIGRDPDDYMALCWFASAGVTIRAVLITPGDADQVAVARFLLKELGCSALMGVPSPDRDKSTITGFHRDLLANQGWPLKMKADGVGTEVIQEAQRGYPEAQFFACGPLDSIGRFVKAGGTVPSITIQGGYCPYHLYAPQKRVAAFEGQNALPTFNLNGNVPAAQCVLGAEGTLRRMVGKNVCHSIVYNRARHQQIMAAPPSGPGGKLLRKAMSLYLERSGDKKFHDPVAAVCHLHPEIGTWIRGRPCRVKGEWTTVEDSNGDHVLVDLNRDAFWKHIASGV